MDRMTEALREKARRRVVAVTRTVEDMTAQEAAFLMYRECGADEAEARELAVRSVGLHGRS